MSGGVFFFCLFQFYRFVLSKFFNHLIIKQISAIGSTLFNPTIIFYVL